MSIQVGATTDKPHVRYDGDTLIDVREHYVGDAFTGDLLSGDVRVFDDGWTATRVGNVVLWLESEPMINRAAQRARIVQRR